MSTTETQSGDSRSAANVAVQVLIGLIVGGAALLAVSALAAFGLGGNGEGSVWPLFTGLAIALIAGLGGVAALRFPALMITAGSVLLLIGLLGLALPASDSDTVDSLWTMLLVGSRTFLLCAIGGAFVGAGIAGNVLARRD